MCWKFRIKHNRVPEELQPSGEEEKAQVGVYQVAVRCYKEKWSKGIDEGRSVILDRMARKSLTM